MNMEKKLYELNVDEEFARLIPPLAEDERKRLEESIQKEGCTDPLMVWNGTIIDGHNRYSVCTKLEIPFTYEEKEDLPDRNAVKAWIIERQLSRRNLNSYQKTDLALEFDSLFHEEAKEKQSLGGKKKVSQNSEQPPNERKSDHKIAEIAGVSRDTVARVRKIKKNADEEMKSALEKGKMSVNKAYTELFGNKTPDTVKVIGNKAIHVEGKFPDEPESFSKVLELLDEVERNYLVSLEHILLQYTSGMVTEEHNKQILSKFRGVSSQATKIINKRIQEVSK